MILGDLSPDNRIEGATDSTEIGNVGDALKVTVETDPSNLPTIEFQDYHHDPFARFRVSQPATLMEFDFTIDPVATNTFGLYWDEDLTGGATAAWDANTVSYKLNVGTASGDKAILKSRRNVEYFKGKSNQWYFTGNFNTLQANVRKRFGCFDENNGVFFETDGTAMYCVVRSSTSGAVVDTRIAQTNWNKDKLDGTGLSGITADPSKQQLFTIDYSWLGSNVVRMGLVVDGDVLYVHQFDFSNNIGTPWAQYGQFPFRYEIENLATTAAADSICVTCGNVNSEGGDLQIGTLKYVSTGTTNVSVTATPVIIAGIQLQSSYVNKSIKTLEFDILHYSGNQPVYWTILYNPTLTAPSWANAASGIAQLLQNQPAYTGGYVLAEGYLGVGTKGSARSGSIIDSEIYIGSDIAGVSDIIVMTMQTISSSGSVLFNGSYREFF